MEKKTKWISVIVFVMCVFFLFPQSALGQDYTVLGEEEMEKIEQALQEGMEGTKIEEKISIKEIFEKVAELEGQLIEIDSLLSDFNHEISSYISGNEFDEEHFYNTQKRLDEINHLKSKYGNSIEEILSISVMFKALIESTKHSNWAFG